MTKATDGAMVPYRNNRQPNPITVRPSLRTKEAITERGQASSVMRRAAHNWFELLDFAIEPPFDFQMGEAATLVAVLGYRPVEPRKLLDLIPTVSAGVTAQSFDLVNGFDRKKFFVKLSALSMLRRLALWDACNRAAILRQTVPANDLDLVFRRVGLVRKPSGSSPDINLTIRENGPSEEVRNYLDSEGI